MNNDIINNLKRRIRGLVFSLVHEDAKAGLLKQTAKAGKKVQDKFVGRAAEIGMALSLEQTLNSSPFDKDKAARQTKEATDLAIQTYTNLYNNEKLVSNTGSDTQRVMTEALEKEIIKVISELFKIDDSVAQTNEAIREIIEPNVEKVEQMAIALASVVGLPKSKRQEVAKVAGDTYLTELRNHIDDVEEGYYSDDDDDNNDDDESKEIKLVE